MADMIMVICIVTSAYFIRGITGFGSGLISIPLLALSHPLTFAIPLLLALDFTAAMVLGGVNRKQTEWSEIKVLLPAGIVGGMVGVVALLKLPEPRVELLDVLDPETLDERGRVAHRAARPRVLEEHSEDALGRDVGVGVADHHLHAERLGPGLHHRDGLRVGVEIGRAHV